MKSLSIIIFTIFILGCSAKPDKKSLVGVWSNCAEDGYYLEICFNETQYRYISNAGKIFHWNNYKFDGKHLSQGNESLKDLNTTDAIVTFINDNKIKIEYTSSDEIWIMEKVNEDIDLSASDQELLNGTLSRAKSSGCCDTLFTCTDFIFLEF